MKTGHVNRLAALLLIFAVAACSPSTAEPTAADTVTTSPTTTPRITDDSGRPPVTFDPCYDLPDDVMTELGYDAAKKELADMPMGWYTFLGCVYKNRLPEPGVHSGYSLNVMAGNVTLDEELEKNGDVATPTTVNGRPALIEVGPNGRNECTYVLQTDFGIVLFNRIFHQDYAAGTLPQDEWCSEMERFANAVEPYINN